MKHTTIQVLLALAFLFTNSTSAQLSNSQPSKVGNPDIVLYSITGMSFLNYPSVQGTLKENQIAYPEIAFNLGAGYYSTFGKVRFGMDFGSGNASLEDDLNITKFIGSFFSINLGYHVLERKGFIVAPLIAYASRRTTMLVERKEFSDIAVATFPLNSTSLTNDISALKFQLSIEKVLRSGLFAGLSLGYDYSLSTEERWKISNHINTSLLKDNMSTFYVNLNIGTHLNYQN